MRPYILIISIILIIACIPIEETEDSLPEDVPEKQVPEVEEKPEIIEPKPLPEEPLLEETQENIIEIKEDSFYPEEKTIEENTEIKWTNEDEKMHLVACYLEGDRVTTSPNLEQGDFFTYTFLEQGEYTCVDAIFGLRSTIIVEAQPLLAPTGSVVGIGSNLASTLFLLVSFLAVIFLLLYAFRKK